jgi:hypothetical protein
MSLPRKSLLPRCTLLISLLEMPQRYVSFFVSLMSDRTKKVMAVHAFPQLKNPASFEYSIRKVSTTQDVLMDPTQKILIAKLQEGVCFSKKEKPV